MKTSQTTLRQLEEFFQEGKTENLCRQLQVPPPDDPLYSLCININTFFKQLSASTGTQNLNNPFPRAILENAPYGIINIDACGNINFSNQLAEFLLAKPDTSLTGLNLIEVLAARKADIKNLKLILNENRLLSPQRISLSIQENNDVITLAFIMIPYQEEENSQQQLSIFIEDRTGKDTLSDAIEFYTENLESMVEHKTREIQAMQVKIIDAERAAAMISTAGGIAHELRQPLTAIIGAAELMVENHDKKFDKKQKHKLDMIYQQSLRMADIIKKMEELVSYQTKDYVTGTKILDITESSKQR